MRASLTRRWFILSVISLGMGGSFAFLVGMSRMPFVSRYLPEDYFQHALAGHVNLAILCWLLLSAIVLWSHHFGSYASRASFWPAAIGVALVALSALSGSGEVVLNNYVPTIINPVFFTGLGLFFIAFCMNVFGFLKEGRAGIGSGDMVTNSLSTGLFIAVVMIAAMLVSLVMLGGDDFKPQVYYERLFWTPGHIQQILNGALLAAVWHALARIAAGRSLKTWGFLVWANRLLVVSALVVLTMLFFFDPLDKTFRVGSEIVYAIGLGIPLFFHIANILSHYKSMEIKPAKVALLFSIAIYLFGIFIAYAGFSNDTRVPAHYHGAVTALTLALMGFAYHMVRGYKIRICFDRIAVSQPYIYGVGMLLFIAGLFVSGAFGAPRKTFGVDWTDNPVIIASMTLMGIGTLLAVIAGALFVLYIAVTLIKKEPVDGRQ